jgi:hypothetical protein
MWSMEIGRSDDLKVRCHWHNVLSSNSDISQEVEVGWIHTSEQVTEREVSDSFRIAVE